jgi:cytochrome c peroxidase
MRRTVLLLAAFALALSIGCSSQEESSEAGSESAATVESVEINEAALAAFSPLPDEMPLANVEASPAKIDLGRMLYYEHRLSKGQEISCNTCHDLETFGVDNDPVSDGHLKKQGNRNSPTVFNAAGHIAQFWDGRAADVIEQAKGPILNPVEMAMPDEAVVVATLKSMPGYVEAFQKAFPGVDDPVTYNNMAEAIGVFETKLVTPSRWDAFLKGDKAALTNAEKTGFNTFIESGCSVCHAGTYLGGHLYNKLGLVKEWPDNEDLGRYEVTQAEADKYFFKVPSLRNIMKTGPYLHDGSIAHVDKMTAMMAEYQLGRELGEEDVASIEAFLGALTGEIPMDYVKKPELPPSGPDTPAPAFD